MVPFAPRWLRQWRWLNEKWEQGLLWHAPVVIIITVRGREAPKQLLTGGVSGRKKDEGGGIRGGRQGRAVKIARPGATRSLDAPGRHAEVRAVRGEAQDLPAHVSGRRMREEGQVPAPTDKMRQLAEATTQRCGREAPSDDQR